LFVSNPRLKETAAELDTVFEARWAGSSVGRASHF
jgi:hypothetical protein